MFYHIKYYIHLLYLSIIISKLSAHIPKLHPITFENVKKHTEVINKFLKFNLKEKM